MRRRCFTLPDSNFTYGAQTVLRDGGVAQGIEMQYHVGFASCFKSLVSPGSCNQLENA